MQWLKKIRQPKKFCTEEQYRQKLDREPDNILQTDGSIRPDPTPMAPPVGYKKQPSMMEHMRAIVQNELSRRAAERGFETFEEADDFEDMDDPWPTSPHENEGDVPVSVLLEEGRRSLAEKAARQSASAAEPPVAGGDDQGVRGAAPGENAQ